MSPGARPPFVVLTAGLTQPEQVMVQQALGTAMPGSRVIRASSLREAAKALRDAEVGCVLAGPALVASGGDWGEVAQELRRGAPQSALIAIPDDDLSLEGFDDVLGPADLEPRLLGRVLRSARAIARANSRLEKWALRDPLTDVLNRRGLELVLHREWSALERGQGPVAVLLVDCDDFKSVNDRFGLAVGDRAIAGVAGAMSGAVRSADSIARVGGDEFLVLLPHTRTWEAVEVAERVRERVSAVILPDGSSLSVSIGVRRLDGAVGSVTELVAQCEEGLKLSKAGGKNQVRVVDPSARGPAPPDPDTSLPPDIQLFGFDTIDVHDLEDGRLMRQLVRVSLDPDSRVRLAAQRAASTNWDLHWLQSGAQHVGSVQRPTHVRLFPGTLADTEPEALLARLPQGFEARHLVVSLDEQYLSGDPSSLIPARQRLREAGPAVCVEASDLGRACIESLVLLRPEIVQVAGALVWGVSQGRARKAALSRFAQVCRSLDVEILVLGVDREADRRALVELGIRLGVGEVSSH